MKVRKPTITVQPTNKNHRYLKKFKPIHGEISRRVNRGIDLLREQEKNQKCGILESA